MSLIPVSFRGFLLNDNGLTTYFDRSFQRPGTRPIQVPRQDRPPITTAVDIPAWRLPELNILIDGSSVDEDALRLGLAMAFDTRSGPGALIVADDDGSNLRYLYVTCLELTQKKGELGDGYVATLEAADEQYWRSVVVESETATLTTSPTNVTVNNDGHLDAYPVVTIEPQAHKSGGQWRYRRFAAVKWTAPVGASYWPTRVWNEDTTGLAPIKATDETSVGLIVDGVEVDRWFAAANGVAGGFNSATTRMWANLNFEAGLQSTLATAVSSGGMMGIWANRIEVNEDISGYPSTGLLQIGDEIFRYRAKDVGRRSFVDVSREMGGTAADHAVGAVVDWIQHEIYICYSPETNVARVADDSRKPLFSLLSSTNSSRTWSDAFGSAAAPARPGQWSPVAFSAGDVFTGEDDGAATDPYEVMGITAHWTERDTGWQIYLPTGISSVSISAELHSAGSVTGAVHVSADGGQTWPRLDQDTLSATTWDLVMLGGSGLAAHDYSLVSFRLPESAGGSMGQVVAATIGLTNGAAAAVLPERTNYSLNMLVLNATTGESIRLAYPVGLSLYEPLVVDCDGERVYTEYVTGAEIVFQTNLYHIMEKNSHRPRMLRLVPGENVLRFTETGLTDVDVTIEWRERTYI